jgi:hypothetical protein
MVQDDDLLPPLPDPPCVLLRLGEGEKRSLTVVDANGETVFTINARADYDADGKLHARTIYRDRDGREISEKEMERLLDLD